MFNLTRLVIEVGVRCFLVIAALYSVSVALSNLSLFSSIALNAALVLWVGFPILDFWTNAKEAEWKK
jgi:hypothetical protein